MCIKGSSAWSDDIPKKEPYWQITINASPYVTSRECVDSHERAMAKLYEAMKTLEYGQTLALYHVDADGFVHPEYKITRQ